MEQELKPKKIWKLQINRMVAYFYSKEEAQKVTCNASDYYDLSEFDILDADRPTQSEVKECPTCQEMLFPPDVCPDAPKPQGVKWPATKPYLQSHPQPTCECGHCQFVDGWNQCHSAFMSSIAKMPVMEEIIKILPEPYLKLAYDATWGDTKHSSNAVRHGYNECLEDVKATLQRFGSKRNEDVKSN